MPKNPRLEVEMHGKRVHVDWEGLTPDALPDGYDSIEAAENILGAALHRVGIHPFPVEDADGRIMARQAICSIAHYATRIALDHVREPDSDDRPNLEVLDGEASD